jgi:hypothetical protein
VISAIRLAAAAEYASKIAAGSVWLAIDPGGVRIMGKKRTAEVWALSQTVKWADIAQDNALRTAIDAVAAGLAAKR